MSRKRKADVLLADAGGDGIVDLPVSLRVLGIDALSVSLSFLDIRSLLRIEQVGAEFLRAPVGIAWISLDADLVDEDRALGDDARTRVVRSCEAYRTWAAREYAKLVESRREERVTVDSDPSERCQYWSSCCLAPYTSIQRYDFFVRFSLAGDETDGSSPVVLAQGMVRVAGSSYFGDEREEENNLRLDAKTLDFSRWKAMGEYLSRGLELSEINPRQNPWRHSLEDFNVVIVAVDRKTLETKLVFAEHHANSYGHKYDTWNPTSMHIEPRSQDEGKYLYNFNGEPLDLLEMEVDEDGRRENATRILFFDIEDDSFKLEVEHWVNDYGDGL